MALCWGGDDGDGRPVVRLSRPMGWLVTLANMALVALWMGLLVAGLLLDARVVDAWIASMLGR